MAKAKKLPSGNWRVRVYAGNDPETKKSIYKSFTAPTKKEAEYLAAEFKIKTHDVERNTLEKSDDITLKEAYSRYIESKSNVLSPTTVREYKRSANRDLQDLMPLKLIDITKEAVQKSINEMAIDHSPKSVRNAHGLLSSVLGVYAPDFQLHTRLPQKEKNVLSIPTEEEVKMLLDSSRGTPLHIAILLGAVGTMRRSEICALTKADLRDNGVMVDKAMVKNENKQWVLKGTKTTAGTRFIDMPKYIIDLLRSLPEDRIYPYYPGVLTNQFSALTKSVLGKSYRFHDLRHYSASVLHAMGVPDLYIMQRGGWESRETLDRVYQHILTKEQQKINKQIIKRFEKAFK